MEKRPETANDILNDTFKCYTKYVCARQNKRDNIMQGWSYLDDIMQGWSYLDDVCKC